MIDDNEKLFSHCAGTFMDFNIGRGFKSVYAGGGDDVIHEFPLGGLIQVGADIVDRPGSIRMNGDGGLTVQPTIGTPVVCKRERLFWIQKS